MNETDRITRTSAYLVYERQEGNRDRLWGIFPDTHEGVQAALESGKEEFDTFAAADGGDEDAYLTKVHGLRIPEVLNHA